MGKWTIDAFARALAEQLCEERWGSADPRKQPRRFLVDDLVDQIFGHIGSLSRARAISPRHPVTRAPADPSSTPDGTYLLTRVDADIAEHYIRSDDRAKKEFPANFAKWQLAGRWMLWQAADILEMKTGESYESHLGQLKEAARNGDFPTYEAGWTQPIKYSPLRPVRETDEVHWFKLNSWLAKHKNPARVPAPTDANLPATNANAATRRNTLYSAIDKAIETAGTRDTNSVWVALMEMGINGESPFTGGLDDGKLVYTNSKNEARSLSKKALGQRLVRRAILDMSKNSKPASHRALPKPKKAKTKNKRKKSARTVEKDR
jgi:hypothetical protein